MSSSSSGVSSEVVFDILSNRRRRMVLYYLRQHGGSATVNELAKEIASLEDDVAVEDLESHQQKRVYVSLYQTHLPKLASTGMIEYDSDKGEVRLADRAGEMDAYLTPPTDSTYPWPYHYVGLVLLSSAVIALSLLDAPLFGSIPVHWIAIGITALLAASTGIHYWMNRRRESAIPPELSEGMGK